MAYNLGEMSAAVTVDTGDFHRKMDALPAKGMSIFAKIGSIAATYFSAKAVVDFAKDSVQAFIGQDAAAEGLRASLRNVGEEYNKQTQILSEYASGLQDITKYEDDATVAAMEQGINLGISANQIKDATKSAMGLAATYRMDLGTAMMLVGRASQGQTQMLTRYGIILKSTGSDQDRFNELLKIGAGNFVLATAQANTQGGTIARLKNKWEDMKEEIGGFLTELFNVKSASGGLIDTVNDMTATIKKRSSEWVFSIKTVWYEIEAVGKFIIALISPVAKYLYVTLQKIAENFGILVRNLVAEIGWVVENWDTLWSHAGEVSASVLHDTLAGIENFSWAALGEFVALTKAIFVALGYIGQAIVDVFSGKGIGDSLNKMFDGFSQTWKSMLKEADAANQDFYANLGKDTERTLQKIGATPFPPLEMPVNPVVDPSDMLKEYGELGKRLDEIDREKRRKQQQAEDDLKAKLAGIPSASDPNNKRDKATSSSENKTLGSFVAAILNQMMGGESPQVETAKNTGRIVKQNERLLKKETRYGA